MPEKTRTRVPLFSMGALAVTMSLLFAACQGHDNPGLNQGNPAAVPVEEITITGGDVTLKTGTGASLSVTVSPENAKNKNVTWSSGDETKVSVDQEGRISALAKGIGIIIKAAAKDGSGIFGFITVNVTDEDPVPVESVIINGGDLNLTAGGSVSLGVDVLPEDAGNKNVSWSSSDDNKVSVDRNGHITAHAEGQATITATAQDGSGVSGSITVTVTSSSGGGGDEGGVIPPPDGGTNISGDVEIIESGGWLETLYVKWNKLAGTVRYNVYYKGGAVSAWTQIDDPLIREYGDYFRADILGLAAAVNYEVEVRPVNGSGAEWGTPGTASNIEVKAHDRSGFAFRGGGTTPGAYNGDGTPKDGARILYVSDTNKETVKLRIIINTNNRDDEFSGLQNILTAYEKGYESRPLSIRFIGRTNEKSNSPFTDKEGTAMIKGNSGRPLAMNLTLEGVGDDAVAHGWGIRTSRANNVEIRNLGFMLANTGQKDAVELQNSKYMWVHNCDFFYMRPGSDSDQKKGDGSLDIKTCDLVTVSYNHFWDSGKSNLLGNGTETPGYLTYHHNWYDHSDSRHPRVRFHQVHVYNNYYDGVAKYGIGATRNSSIFAEGNYFRNTKKPLLISMQGSDTASGGGSFSSEDGGIIKAYNNYMDARSAAGYRPYSASNTVEFDAYETGSAGGTVPATVTSKKGGFSYSNFDTIYGYTYTVDDPETAKQNVETWSGRYWGGDFSYTFNNATDDAHSDDPMPALLAALNAYTSGLVRIQGDGGSGGGDDGGGTDEPPPPIEGAVMCSFDASGVPSNSAFTKVAGNGTKASLTINGTTYDTALKLESSTSLTFTTAAPMTLTAYTSSAGINLDGGNIAAGGGVVTVNIAPGPHTVKRHSGSGNLWLIVLTPVQ